MPGLDSVSRLIVRDKADRAKELADIAASDVHVADHSESDSDSESDESSSFGDYTYETMIEDLKTDIQCLVDLGPRYKEPIRDKVVEEESSMSAQVKTWDPAEYLTSRIRHRYPNGDVALTQVLGQVNWERARRLYALKETNAGAGQRPAPGTKPPGTVVASDFYDSGLGTSVATPSSYAETVFSYHGTQGGSIKIPPVPTEGLDGNPFPCDICGRMCRLPGASWKSLWKYAQRPLPFVLVVPLHSPSDADPRLQRTCSLRSPALCLCCGKLHLQRRSIPQQEGMDASSRAGARLRRPCKGLHLPVVPRTRW